MDNYVALWKSSPEHLTQNGLGKGKREASKEDFQNEVITELTIKMSEG